MKRQWVKYKDTHGTLDAQEGAMVSKMPIQSKETTGYGTIKPDGKQWHKPEFTVEPDGLITVK